MEFQGTACVIEVRKVKSPWTSVELIGTIEVFEIGKLELAEN